MKKKRMSYTALYRKWRPAIFDDVKGQAPIVTALKNQVRSERIGHAYLFCGTRGTGKTSVAKILAKAVNCQNPVNGNPCNECPNCQAVISGASINVVEIDAASNNGVDNIREIREEVRYAPAEGKYRVYIIDEVHMLSTGAFNALLKTLEEPPAHVIFILATTEAHKIPITVLSRCQRYDFRRISTDIIESRLKELTDGENVEIEERALHYIARKGDGSLRDAISLLDQCIAFHFHENLTYQKVLNVLGAASYELFANLLTAALEGRTADCIYQIDDIVMQGRELGQLVSDFIWYLRNLMLLKSSDLDADTLEVTEEEILDLGRMAASVSMDTLLRYIRIFSKLSGDIRNTTDKRVLLEMTFIRLTHPETEQNLDSVLHRIENLEHRMEEEIHRISEECKQRPVVVQSVQETDVELPWEPEIEQSVSIEPVQSIQPAKQVVLEHEQYVNYQNISEDWDKIIENLPGHFEKIALRGTHLEPVIQADNTYIIVFTDAGKYGLGCRDITMRNVEETASSMIGRPMQFRAKLDNDSLEECVQYVSKNELADVFQGIDIIEED